MIIIILILVYILFIFYKFIYYITKCLDVLARAKDVSDLGKMDYYIQKASAYSKFRFQKNIVFDIRTIYFNLYLLFKKN